MYVRLIFIFLLSCASTYGQTTINGTLTCGAKAVSGVSVVVQQRIDGGDIIAYDTSGEDGVFRLNFTCNCDSVAVFARSMNYRDTILWLANRNHELELELPAKVYRIREVRARGYPIIGKGDTIIYTVNSFARGDDRSIGDVIRRMPGFEVDDRGQIFYQGSPIQKYYIEGMDLLEKRYAVANRNLPHRSVGSVEVLQRHQPIKMLEKKIASDATALNIKLKKGVAVTGTLRAGVGFSPLLREVNLTPMLFQKKQQMIASFQSNNTGDDLDTQHSPLEINIGEIDGLQNRKPDFVRLSSPGNPPVETKRYLNNNAHMLTYNHLFKVTQDKEVKINTSYYHDRIGEKGNLSTIYFLDGKNVTIEEVTSNKYGKSSINAALILTTNAPGRYLKNTLGINNFWDNDKGIILSETEQRQKTKTPHFSVSNVLDMMFPVKKNFMRLYSLIDYDSSPQKLLFTPGVFPDELNNGYDYGQTTQNYEVRELVSHHFFQFTTGMKQWKIESEPGIKFEVSNRKTFLVTDNTRQPADSLNNDLDRIYTEIYLKEKISYDGDNFHADFTLPLSYVIFNLKDPRHVLPGMVHKLFFTPSVFMRYDLSRFLTAKFTLRYTSSADDSRMAQGYILSDYRQMSRQSGKLSEREGYRYIINLEYRDLVSGFFSNLSWTGSANTNNLLTLYSVKSNGIIYHDAVKMDNKLFTDNLSVKISQYFSRLQATIDIKGDYARNKRQYLVNDALGWRTYRLFVLNPGISVSRLKFIDLGYSYNCQLARQKNMQAKTTVTEQKHKWSVLITPMQRHFIAAKCEYYDIKQKGSENFNVFFADVSYNFRPAKGKLRFRVELNNIFNHSEIIRYYTGDISLTRSGYRIRPRQVLATVSVGL